MITQKQGRIEKIRISAKQSRTEVKVDIGFTNSLARYTATLNLTKKVDVYSFGVLLLEVICGRFPIIRLAPGEETHIVEWVQPLVNRGKIEEIIDRSMVEEYNVSAAWKVVDIALRCVEFRSPERPSMDEVCMELRASMRLEMDDLVTTGLELGPTIDYTPNDVYNDVQAR